MKILVVCPYFYPAISFGGVTTSSFKFAHELAKRKHEVVVFTSDAKDKSTRLHISPVEDKGGVTIHYFKNITSGSLMGLFFTPGLLGVIKQKLHNFDIVHLHEYRTFQNIVISRFARRIKLPYVLQPHGTLPRIAQLETQKLVFDTLLGNSILKHAAAGIPMSRFEQTHFANLENWSSPLEIIPNAVDLQDFNKSHDEDEFRRKFGIEDNSRFILFLGRLSRIKGIDILVKAFARVIESTENVILVIAGPDDGELRKLKTITESLGISDQVVFTGLLYSLDKVAALKACEFLVLPSWYELFSTAILEAFACGKPVIGSSVGSTPDLVIHNKTGLLFRPGNILQLSKHIFDLLSNADELVKLGKNAKELVEGTYTVDKVVAKLETLYDSIL